MSIEAARAVLETAAGLAGLVPVYGPPLAAGLGLIARLVLDLRATAADIEAIDPRKLVPKTAADARLDAKADEHDPPAEAQAPTVPPPPPTLPAGAPLPLPALVAPPLGLTGDDEDVAAFRMARNYKPSLGRRRVLWVVLHSVEGPRAVSRKGDALAVVEMFAGPGSPEVSTHYVVDPECVVQGVRENDVAWAAPGANDLGIQVEQCGQAMHTDWTSGAGLAVVKRSARLVGRIACRWGVPLVAVGADEVLQGVSGITLHSHVTDAAKMAQRIPAAQRTPIQAELARVAPYSSHQDPGGPRGIRWPMLDFMAYARE